MLVYFAIIIAVLLGFCGLAIGTDRIGLRQNFATCQPALLPKGGTLVSRGAITHTQSSTYL